MGNTYCALSNDTQIESCIETSDSAPLEAFMKGTEKASQRLCSCMKFGDRLVMGMIKIPNFKSRAKKLFSSTSGCPTDREQEISTLMQDAKETESLLITEWNSQLPTDFRYTSLPLLLPKGESCDILQDTVYNPPRIDTYHDPLVAHTWNQWRTNRIQLLVIIAQCARSLYLARDRPDKNSDYVDAIATTRQLVDDISSSIPYHLQYMDQPSAHPPGAGPSEGNQKFGTGNPGQGLLLVPHLRSILEVQCVPGSQKQWIREHLAAMCGARRP